MNKLKRNQMKFQIALLILLLFLFGGVAVSFAQSQKIDPKNTIITMKQETENGFIIGRISPYVITILGDGTVTFDGMDAGKAVSPYEIPVKVFRKYKISKSQVTELIAEFEKIDFFSLNDSYRVRDNSNGTYTVIADGGLATVITSIALNGKTKTVKNINFAPEKLIELQRKIYLFGNLAQFIKIPPYWLSKFPNQMFPPRSANNNVSQDQPPVLNFQLRKIPRRSPQNKKDGQIDPARNWGIIKPCLSNKAEIEKLLGQPINKDDPQSLPFYNLKNEQIQIFYANDRNKNEICGSPVPIDTAALLIITPIKDLRLLDLNVDLKTFKVNNDYGFGVKSYINLEKGIRLETEIVEFSDKKQIEMVTRINFSRKISQ